MPLFWERLFWHPKTFHSTCQHHGSCSNWFDTYCPSLTIASLSNILRPSNTPLQKEKLLEFSICLCTYHNTLHIRTWSFGLDGVGQCFSKSKSQTMSRMWSQSRRSQPVFFFSHLIWVKCRGGGKVWGRHMSHTRGEQPIAMLMNYKKVSTLFLIKQ